jgi:hypothetical protein
MGPQVLRASLPLLASAGQGKLRRYSFDPGLASFEKIRGKKNNLLFCWLLQKAQKNNKLFFSPQVSASLSLKASYS